jgi:CDP-glycerol glycerophosphotransferase (TagB/SpsB family)
MQRLFLYLLAALARIWLFPIYWLSGFMPRRRHLWVFGSWGGHRYADNGAAFFEYCHDHITRLTGYGRPWAY